MLTNLGTSKAAQIAVASSAILVVGTCMASILIAQIQGNPIPMEVQILIAFITGSGTTLLGHQQAGAALLRAQQQVPETQQALQSPPTNGVH